MEIKDTSKTLPVHTIEKKLSHVKKMKRQFASNRATILKNVGIREIDYEMKFFESGCLFLEQIFGYASDNYNNFSKDSKYMFWAWFSAEFKILENDFINVIIGVNLKLKEDVWLELVESIPHDAFIEKSFYHYLKRLGNVKL